MDFSRAFFQGIQTPSVRISFGLAGTPRSLRLICPTMISTAGSRPTVSKRWSIPATPLSSGEQSSKATLYLVRNRNPCLG